MDSEEVFQPGTDKRALLDIESECAAPLWVNLCQTMVAMTECASMSEQHTTKSSLECFMLCGPSMNNFARSHSFALAFLALSLACGSDDPDTTADASTAEAGSEASVQTSPCPDAQPLSSATCSGRYTQEDVTPMEENGVELSCAYEWVDCDLFGFVYNVFCGCDDGKWYCTDTFACHTVWEPDATTDASPDGGTGDAAADAALDAN